eukprot:TRINITY_DN106174_c0_g1_i1.p1 TRINITY_DN106174_c0_g1~~TRINITY_DN106174_c0_g1_i1.p1  ORF type:complete len:137 (+),score=9.92 TRINITY_DN106174_c0_g1_i1:24-413(+)
MDKQQTFDDLCKQEADPEDVEMEVTSSPSRTLEEELYVQPSVPKESKWRRRWRKTPKKMVFMSTALFTGGVIFLLLGLLCLGECDLSRAVGMIVVGVIMVLPGGYSAYILVNYWRGVRGFHHNQLPQYD